jgi:mono/diheme cytochrome c family protein
MTTRVAIALVVCLVLADGSRSEPTELPPPSRKEVDFGRDVKPIFAAHCAGCHGPEKQRGGLRLDRKSAALAGGDSGPAFRAGKSSDSLLVRLVAGLEPKKVMPPGDRKPLTPDQVGVLRAWIDQGLKWPDDVGAENGPRPGSDHWAFRPVRRPEPPAVRTGGWVRNPVDRFILARLEKEGIAPSPEADPFTLLRRLHLDLIGLPPTPEEIDRFAREWAAKPQAAYEEMVERMLSSPHFG